MRAVVVTGSGTGVGKTLVTAVLAAALHARGLRVQPYKVGPDYIDGRLHEMLVGRPCANLDLWLDGAAGIAHTIDATYGDADIAIVEGMMGAFDGDHAGETSTVAVAAVIDAPLLLVLDGWTASQTLAAVAYGLRERARPVRTIGAVLNRVGGPSHAAAIARACEACEVPIVATIPYDAGVAVDERRLGLQRAQFAQRAAAIRALALRLAAELDVPALLAASAASPPSAAPRTAAPIGCPRPRVAVADDEAFWFTYPETRLALAEAGAEIVPFSPVHDATLPAGIAALWLSGGFPEDYAAALAANAPLRDEIRAAVACGVPTYAECGGYMYLGESLETADDTYPMVGAVRSTSSMREPALRIGYREATVMRTTPLDDAGTIVRGYEYHYASARSAAETAAYTFEGHAEGVADTNLCASFLHRRFLPGDRAIARFLDAARRRIAPHGG